MKKSAIILHANTLIFAPEKRHQMNLKSSFLRPPDQVIQSKRKEINIFNIDGKNIDKKVVQEFGEEWLKFSEFTDKSINEAAEEYFDIIDESMVNSQTYALDIGCGTGRWTKYLSTKAGFIEAIDPSNAIFAAGKLLEDVENVRLTKASVETLPFADETFDFGMSIGVLHHIPDTQQALTDCVKKIKKGGHFYVYLYYDLDKRGILFKTLFSIVNAVRLTVSKLPNNSKKIVCDILAIVIYLPLVLLGQFFSAIGLKKIAKATPLSYYQNKTFFIIRNDALDRFGTRLEQRFSKEQIIEMMRQSGLTNIKVSPGVPYYHAVGKKL
ncbi:MAG: class I SAM-dependent methyltransferase [Ginsengibacter sp.]